MSLNKTVLKRAAMLLYKDGDSATEDEIKSVVHFLEFLALPKATAETTDPGDYTIDEIENYLLILYKEKQSQLETTKNSD